MNADAKEEEKSEKEEKKNEKKVRESSKSSRGTLICKLLVREAREREARARRRDWSSRLDPEAFRDGCGNDTCHAE